MRPTADLRLVDAARRQDRAAVRSLLAQRADVKAVQPDGAGVLHWAAHWDDVEMAGMLIDAGADVNVRNDLGVTPLLVASTNASAPMVDRLLAAGANPNVASVGGESPLLVAARAGNAAVVKALLAKGAQVDASEPVRGQTALMWAAANRRADVVRALIQGGASIHARSTIVPREYQTGSRYVAYDDVRFVVKVDDGGFTPLLFAARSGDAPTADLLLAAGAKLDEPAPSGASPLVIAAHSGNRDVALLLLERGAEPNAAGAGYTALHAAVLRGDLRVVEALVARGAKVDAPLERGTPVRRYSQDYAFSADLIGATPFWLAARYGDLPHHAGARRIRGEHGLHHGRWIERAHRGGRGVLGFWLRRSPRALSHAGRDRRQGGSRRGASDARDRAAGAGARLGDQSREPQRRLGAASRRRPGARDGRAVPG